MLDRPAAHEARPSAAGSPIDRRWPLAFLGGAGLLGAAGVGIGAAGAHMGGGDLARTSSDFLLLHAAAEAAACGIALALPRVSMALVAAMALLLIGSALFGGGLALAGLADWRPLPLAAPIGGMCLIAGWLMLAVAALTLSVRRR